jgi:hypothetical protein
LKESHLIQDSKFDYNNIHTKVIIASKKTLGSSEISLDAIEKSQVSNDNRLVEIIRG